MKENTNFNLSRFGKLLKADLTANKKSYLFRVLGEYIAFMLAAIPMMTIGISYDKGTSLDVELSTLGTLGFCVIIFGLLCLRSASLILECMNTKEKSIHYLMLPASNFEKFMARTSISTFLFILVATPVAFLFTEVTRLLLMIMIHHVELNTPDLLISEMFLRFLKDVSDCSEYTTNLIITVILGYAFTHSLFILGGCIWRKHAMLKTIGVLLFFDVVVQPLLLSFIPENIDSVMDIDVSNISPWVIIQVGIAGLTLLCWWLSYRLFCRKQVI